MNSNTDRGRAFYQWTLVFLFIVGGLPPNWVQAEQPTQTPSATIGGIVVTLSAPLLTDGLDAEGQAAVLKRVAGQYPLESFVKPSINSPFTLRRKTIESADKRPLGFEIGLWFVAEGSLETIRSENMFAAMIEAKAGDDDETHGRLSDEELAARSIPAPSTDTDEEQQSIAYYHFSVPVLDRVIVDGVVHGTSSSSEKSYWASVTLDDAFRSDDHYPNRWRHADADISSAMPYSGFTAYAKATKLIAYENSVLIECHAVIHEPREWFAGTSMLSSKLPLAVQTAVRRFPPFVNQSTDKVNKLFDCNPNAVLFFYELTIMSKPLLCFTATCLLLLPTCAYADETAPDQKPPAPEANVSLFSGMFGSLADMTIQMSDKYLDYLAKPETARKLATFQKNYYDSLIELGFNKEQAFTLLRDLGNPMIEPGRKGNKE